MFSLFEILDTRVRRERVMRGAILLKRCICVLMCVMSLFCFCWLVWLAVGGLEVGWRERGRRSRGGGKDGGDGD